MNTDRPTIDSATSIDELCDQFERLWQAEQPPRLLAWLQHHGWHPTAGDQRLANELVCIDIEFRWRRFGELATSDFTPLAHCPLAARPAAADYAAWLYGDSQYPLPIEWVKAEYRLRKLADDQKGAEALREQHRQRPHVIAALASVDDELDTLPRKVADTKTRSSHGIEVRCPHCRHTVRVGADHDLSNVNCQVCGSAFNLVSDVKETRAAETVTRIGNFELIERLGMGGFGSVWKARDTQLERTVAIKLPRRGELTPEQTQMFLREARAAAQLHHPNIVAVHEVGLHDDSLYLVSDFVRGVSLSELLASDQRLSMLESAGVCSTLASALHHAHECGVIHRDLKPANIMMDDAGRPHLMDFGLAKREVGDVTMTVEGQILGTPAYMSPEQARGDGDKADRRTDIYSLGAVLFEMITGEMPFRGSAQMLLRQVINDEPPPPRALNRSVPLDLQTICLKCLEKEPSKRYATAADLAGDLNAFLDGRPIQARRIGSLERRWRWCKRNPVVASLAATAAGLLLAVAVVASVGYAHTARALREKDAAAATSEQVSRFLTNLFVSSDPLQVAMAGEEAFSTPNPADLDRTAKDLLQRGAQRIRTELKNQPAVRAELLDTIGAVYTGLGQYQESTELLREALDLRVSQLPRNRGAISTTKHHLGVALHLSGNYEEGGKYLSEALDERTAEFGASSVEATATMGALGLLLVTQGEEKRAEQLLKKALSIRQAMFDKDDPRIALTMSQYVAMLLAVGREEEAQGLVQEVLWIASARKNQGDWVQAGQVVADYQAGRVALGKNDIKTAIRLLGKASHDVQVLLGENHPFVALGLFEYGKALEADRQYQQAIEELQRAIRICDKTISQKHPKMLIARHGLSSCYYQQGDLQRSLKVLDRLLPDGQQVYGKTSYYYASWLLHKSLVLSDLQRHDQAIATGLEAFRLAAQVGEHPHLDMNEFAREVADRHRAAGDVEAAAAFLQNYMEQLEQPADLETHVCLVRALIEAEKLEQAGLVIEGVVRDSDLQTQDKQRFRLLEAERLLAAGQVAQAERVAHEASTVLRATEDKQSDLAEQAAELMARIAAAVAGKSQSSVSEPAIVE